MAINLDYENWRQAGDPMAPNDGTVPSGWTTSSQHGGTIVNGTYTVAQPTAQTTTLTTSNTQTPEQQAASMLSGMTSPMTLDQIREREANERAARRASADALFNPTIQRAQTTGAAQVSSAEGVTGQSQGFNISTAEAQYINSVQGQVNDRIAEIEKSKADWIATGDFQAAQRADDAIAKLSEYNNNLIIKKAELALSIGQSRRQDAELDINTITALSKIPAGQSVVIGGKTYTGTATPDPFFSGSDVTSMMKELPIGQTKQITDPSTGKTYTITGIASSDPNVKTIQSYDNAGNLTITSYKIDPMTGKVSVMNQVNGGNVGKSKTSGGTGAILSRTILNKLNAKGLPDDQAMTVSNLLKQYDRATAENILAQGLAQQNSSGNISIAPELAKAQYGNQAKQMIDNYNSIINSSSSWLDGLESSINGAISNLNQDQNSEN